MAGRDSALERARILAPKGRSARRRPPRPDATKPFCSAIVWFHKLASALSVRRWDSRFPDRPPIGGPACGWIVEPTKRPLVQLRAGAGRCCGRRLTAERINAAPGVDGGVWTPSGIAPGRAYFCEVRSLANHDNDPWKGHRGRATAPSGLDAVRPDNDSEESGCDKEEAVHLPVIEDTWRLPLDRLVDQSNLVVLGTLARNEQAHLSQTSGAFSRTMRVRPVRLLLDRSVTGAILEPVRMPPLILTLFEEGSIGGKVMWLQDSSRLTWDPDALLLRFLKRDPTSKGRYVLAGGNAGLFQLNDEHRVRSLMRHGGDDADIEYLPIDGSVGANRCRFTVIPATRDPADAGWPQEYTPIRLVVVQAT